jgi:hypothetical protein
MDEEPAGADEAVEPGARPDVPEPIDRYPRWMTWSMIAGGVIAVLTAGILLNFGFLSESTSEAQTDMRWAAQVLGTGCLGLGLLSIVVPFADHDRARRGHGDS